MDPEEQEQNGTAPVAERTPIVRTTPGAPDAMEQQATRIAEAMLPQLEPSIQARVEHAVRDSENRILASMQRGLGNVARGLRPPTRENARGSGPTPFASHADFLQAVLRSSRQGAMAHEHLIEIAAATGMSESIGADGGFVVQSDHGMELLERIAEAGILYGMIPANRKFTASGNANSREMPVVDETSRANGSRIGGVQAYWRSEAAAVTASRPKFAMLTLKLDAISGLTYHTTEEAEDTPGLSEMTYGFHTEEIAFKLDDVMVRGDGETKPLGALNSPALVTVDAETGQPADTVVYANVAKIWARMPARSRRTAVWFYNQELEPQLAALYLAIGTGGIPVWMPAGGISGLPYPTLFGRPAIALEQASAKGDVGDIMCIDPASYIELTKGGARRSLSQHVAFTTGEIALRTDFRVDIQPGWKSALTPYKGSDTISPFVTLAAR